MPLTIHDPASGNTAAVDADHRLDVRSKSISELALVAREKGLAFSWSNVDYNYSAADTILAVENNSATRKLYITEVLVAGDVASEVIVHRPTSDVTMAGTAVTGVNLNGGSGESADATAKANESGNTQGDVLARVRIAAAGNSVSIKLPAILSQNQMIGVDFVTVGTKANVTILGFFA